jgi:dephospho-CoA kinase
MIKIGITGSIASGKTTASQILSYKRGPLFSADAVVNKLYKKIFLKKLLKRKFNIKQHNLKKILKKIILQDSKQVKILEKIIHPLVRKEMKKFSINNQRKKTVFYEIPLLIESNLMKHFDIIIFIKAKKKIRLNRFLNKGGEKKIFNLLSKRQFSDIKKAKFSDHIVVNEKNLNIFKKNLSGIISQYV